jgi:hypothetical protein
VSMLRILGTIAWTVTIDGRLIRGGQVPNLVTRTGDQLYGERGAGVSGALAAPTGMKLGTGTTPPAKTGTGATLAAYLSNSHQAFSTAPASSLVGSSRRVTYVATWAAGKATTATPITEAVIVNETLADSTSAAGATIARALIPIGTKAAGVAVTVTWVHDLLGS